MVIDAESSTTPLSGGAVVQVMPRHNPSKPDMFFA
jgi:hypothetical protein